MRERTDELARCELLGLFALIFHPGSNPDEAAGLALAAEGMAQALEAVPGRVKLLLETTAGQGFSLGHAFEQLAAIREAIPAKLRRRTGVCLDTCHLFAAGYDLTTDEGYAATIERLEGLGHVVHGNLIKIINRTHPELSVQRGPRATIDPWQDDNVIYCTQKGYERRKGEIDYLTRVKIPENAKAIGEAAAHGNVPKLLL